MGIREAARQAGLRAYDGAPCKCVRGLLCKRCNRLIGDASESSAVLLAAAAYLQRHGK